ncbi:hypothetical protein BH23BAC1_BH23BAC1_39460 [soil metagenome]
MTAEYYSKENSEYFKNNPTWHVEDSPWKAKQILKILDKNMLKPKSIVEVGCGAGEILNQLYLRMSNEVVFTGYDISYDAIQLAKLREKDRLTYKQENFLGTKIYCDLLLIIDVFEHVDNYLTFLRSCKGKAVNTIFHIPLDISVQAILRNKLTDMRKSVGHLHYFTKETAIATLVDAGFEIIDFCFTGSRIDLPLKSFRSKLAVLPRKILFNFNKDFTVKILGGFSLLVLAK